MQKSEVESRTQGSKPRPRTQKKSEARTALPRTDTLEAKDRNARGQGPRTQGQVLSKKKRSTQKFFQALHKILTNQKLVLSSSSRGQANF